MSSATYFPTPTGDAFYKCTQLGLRRTPVIGGFLSIYQQNRDSNIAKKHIDSNQEKAVSWYCNRQNEYSKSQVVAGIISIIIGVSLLALRLLMPASTGLMIGGSIAMGVGGLHLMLSHFIKSDEIKEIGEKMSNLTWKLKKCHEIHGLVSQTSMLRTETQKLRKFHLEQCNEYNKNLKQSFANNWPEKRDMQKQIM